MRLSTRGPAGPVGGKDPGRRDDQLCAHAGAHVPQGGNNDGLVRMVAKTSQLDSKLQQRFKKLLEKVEALRTRVGQLRLRSRDGTYAIGTTTVLSVAIDAGALTIK